MTNTLKVLRSESDYKAALDRFEKLLSARKEAPGTMSVMCWPS